MDRNNARPVQVTVNITAGLYLVDRRQFQKGPADCTNI